MGHIFSRMQFALVLLSIVLASSFGSSNADCQDKFTLENFAHALDEEYVNGVRGDDQALVNLLCVVFESDWSKAKECLLFDRWPVEPPRPSHDAGLQLMEELVKMRSRVCGDIATKTQSKIVDYLGDLSLEGNNPIAQEGMSSAFYEERSKADARSQFNPLAPTGAEKRTSDIDVASNGLNTELGVKLFNQVFRESMATQWDPATVFDYNVYAADWIFPSRFSEVQTSDGTELTPNPEHILVLDAGAIQADDDRLQVLRAEVFENAALLHIRRNCSEEEWGNYIRVRLKGIRTREQLVDQLVGSRWSYGGWEFTFGKGKIENFSNGWWPDVTWKVVGPMRVELRNPAPDVSDIIMTMEFDSAESFRTVDWDQRTEIEGQRIGKSGVDQLAALVANQLQVVDSQFRSFQAEIDSKKIELSARVPKPSSAWRNGVEYYDEALETLARNRIYEDRLLKVKALRLHYRVLMSQPEKSDSDRQQMFTLAKQITESLTDALYFANEVYATEGATLHATQAIQKVSKAKKAGKVLRVKLTDHQYLQAFYENVGDSLHSLEHYKDFPAYAVYRSGKYIDRMLLAAGVLAARSPTGKNLLQNHPNYRALKRLGERAVATKESEDGDDPLKIAEKEEFISADLDRLREAVLEIGCFVPGIL